MSQVNDLPFKKRLKIIGFSTCSASNKQLLTKMGILPGTFIMLIRKAPLGDPIQISIRDTQITLPKALVENLQLEVMI